MEEVRRLTEIRNCSDSAAGADELLAAHTRLGAYEIIGTLGQGGMGVVYEAIHLGLGKRVALKTLRQRLSSESELVQRFLREARAASAIRHPNVVDVTDIDVYEGRPFLVMELLTGETLAKALRRGALSPAAAIEVILPIAYALERAHEHHVVHRDIKPANIFLAHQPGGGPPIPKLLDFGIAKLSHSSATELTQSNAILGTPQYLSPEQISYGATIDHRTDQYSLGVVLYQCLTGLSPFADESVYRGMMMILNGMVRAPREVAPELPLGLERVILKAMHRSPDLRFGSMRAFGDALLPFAGERAKWMYRGGSDPASDESPVTVDQSVAALTSSDLDSVAAATRSEGDIAQSLNVHMATLPVHGEIDRPRWRWPPVVLATLGACMAVGFGAWFGVLRGDDPLPPVSIAPMPARAPSMSTTAPPADADSATLERARVALTEGQLDLAERLFQAIASQTNSTLETRRHAHIGIGNVDVARLELASARIQRIDGEMAVGTLWNDLVLHAYQADEQYAIVTGALIARAYVLPGDPLLRQDVPSEVVQCVLLRQARIYELFAEAGVEISRRSGPTDQERNFMRYGSISRLRHVKTALTRARAIQTSTPGCGEELHQAEARLVALEARYADELRDLDEGRVVIPLTRNPSSLSRYSTAPPSDPKVQ